MVASCTYPTAVIRPEDSLAFYIDDSINMRLPPLCRDSSFIRPHLEYTSIVWSPSLKGEIDKLEDIQKFALRVYLKSWDKNYDDLLLNSELPSLQKRRVLASLCHLYKIL